MEINEALIRAREQKEKNQEDIANILYTTQQQISLYETGKREMKASQIITLCKALNITSDYLLGLTNKH